MAKKAWTTKRRTTLADDIDLLLRDLCVQWGFCNRLFGDELLRDVGSITAEAFAAAVLRAEGMNPETELEWRRKMKRAFVERYGQVEVSEGSYNPQLS